MNAIEAGKLYDQFHSRTEIEVINNEIRLAASQGRSFLTTRSFDSITASRLKDFFKTQGYFVSKILESNDPRGSYDTYVLQIWWARKVNADTNKD